MRSPPTTTAMLFLVDIIRSLLIQLIYWVLNQVGKWSNERVQRERKNIEENGLTISDYGHDIHDGQD